MSCLRGNVIRTLAAAFTLLVGGGAVFGAESSRELISRGNADFAGGRFQEALDAYKSATPADGIDDAMILHNQAAAHFKLGQITEARDLWVRVASMKDAAFEAQVRYNLGNCAYAEALAAAKGEQIEGAIEQLEKATEQYRDALKLNPRLGDARANLELAARLKKELKEQATTQPSSRPTPDNPNKDQQQQQQDQQKQNSKSQNQKSDQKQDGENKQDGEQQDKQDQSQKGGKDKQSQKQQSESDRQNQNGNQQKDQSDDQKGEGTEGEQQKSADEEEDGQPQRQIQYTLTKEQMEKLLQMVRDRERQRRKAMALREAERQAGQHRPVEKDW